MYACECVCTQKRILYSILDITTQKREIDERARENSNSASTSNQQQPVTQDIRLRNDEVFCQIVSKNKIDKMSSTQMMKRNSVRVLNDDDDDDVGVAAAGDDDDDDDNDQCYDMNCLLDHI